MAERKKYPAYMYHKNDQTPRLIESPEDERALEVKGWTRVYIKHEYPKWVNGTIVHSKEQHEALIAASPEMKTSLGPLPEEQGPDSPGRRGKAK